MLTVQNSVQILKKKQKKTILIPKKFQEKSPTSWNLDELLENNKAKYTSGAVLAHQTDWITKNNNLGFTKLKHGLILPSQKK